MKTAQANFDKFINMLGKSLSALRREQSWIILEYQRYDLTIEKAFSRGVMVSVLPFEKSK